MVSLVEMLAAAAISGLLIASLAGYSFAQHPYALRAAVQNVSAVLADGRSIAQTSGNGATIVVSTNGTGYWAALYPFRPTQNADVTVPPVRKIAGNVSLTPIAIFISSSGTVSSSTSWSPASGTLPAEPPCTAPIALTFTAGASSETHTIPCGNAELQ